MKYQIILDTLYTLASDLSQAIDYYSQARSELMPLMKVFGKGDLKEKSDLIFALYLVELDTTLKRDLDSLDELRTLIRNARILFRLRSLFFSNDRVSSLLALKPLVDRVLSSTNSEISTLRNAFTSLDNIEGMYIAWGKFLKNINNGKLQLENVSINIEKLKELNEDDSVYELHEQSWEFIKDDELKKIIVRDYDELRRILKVQAPKSAIVLSGSILEAVLVNIIRQNEDKGKQAYLKVFTKVTSAPPIQEWSLNQLILIGAELGILDGDTKRHADVIREYRNLIHPMVEVRRNSGLDNEILIAHLSLLKRIFRVLSDSKAATD